MNAASAVDTSVTFPQKAHVCRIEEDISRSAGLKCRQKKDQSIIPSSYYGTSRRREGGICVVYA
jgi:hypothetical protein